MILKRARHDFRRARAVAVGEEHDRHVGELALLRRAIVLIRVRDAPARVDDHLAARQEFVGHLDRLIQRAARVAADVEEQPAHALRRQLVQRVLHIAIGVLAEILHADVAGGRVDHEERRHRGNRDFVARDLQRDEFLVAPPPDADFDDRALRAAQLLHRLLGRPALGVLGANPGDNVAPAYALLERRRALEDARRHHVAVGRVLDGDAEAVVVPFLPLAHLRVFAGIEEARMRIERAEHAANRAIHEPIGFNLVDVIGLDGA